MADRVKYFLLGLLFLVVAGVVAYERWNSTDASEFAKSDPKDRATVRVEPPPVSITPPRVEPAPVRPAPPAPVTPEPPPLPAPRPPPPSPVHHVVAENETLEAIALRYYKSTKGIEWIVRANDLRDANFLRVKQKLVIPPAPEGEAAQPAGLAKAQDAPKEKPAPPGTYRVKPGETDLYAICRKLYGAEGLPARVARVMDENGLYSATVTPGALLRLPKE